MRVLLIDDAEDSVSSLSILLKRKGHELRTALSSEFALRLAAEFVPDAVCLDICMPDIDGYDLAKALRQLTGMANVAIIANSGYASDRARLDEAGIDAYVIKPVSSVHIDELIRELVDRRSTRN